MVKIHSRASVRINELWIYTKQTWGEEQADRFLDGLVQALHNFDSTRNLARSIEDKRLGRLHFLHYEHHYLFFDIEDTGDILLLSVLHEKMDIPSRLRDELKRL